MSTTTQLRDRVSSRIATLDCDVLRSCSGASIRYDTVVSRPSDCGCSASYRVQSPPVMHELMFVTAPGVLASRLQLWVVSSAGSGGDRNIVRRHVFRFRHALLRHGFEAIPAPGATAVFCFTPFGSRSPTTNLPPRTRPRPAGDFLRVPPRKQTLGLGAGPTRLAPPGVP